MKRNRTRLSRAGTVLLALLLCLALLPTGAFATDTPSLDNQGEGQEMMLTDEASDEVTDSEYPEEAAEVIDSEAGADADVPEDAAGGSDKALLEACEHELVAVAEVPSTCMKSGHKAYRECTKCGALFDAVKAKEVQWSDLVYPIADHKWDKGTVVREATASKNGIKRFTCSVCGATYDEDIYYAKPVATAKSLTLDSNKLQFSSAVAKSSPSFMKNAKIGRTWVKAAKTSMKLNWKNAGNMRTVDGVIIMRATGSSKVYKEIKRLQFKSVSGGVTRWNPKTSYTDKTAKKKNTPYKYIVLSYLKKDDVVYISHCSDWCAGQTTASKLKSVYKAKINKKSASLQYKGKVSLKLKYAKPKKTYLPKNFRWYSDNTKVAKVSSKGAVTATGVGSTTIRGRLASGDEVTCKVSVVGAFTPSTPKISVDVANESSITLIWTKAKKANAYDLYRSDDGLHWKNPVKVKGTSKKVTGLKKGHRYTFYVVARNDNHGYTAYSRNSNVIYQKAVIKRRPSTLSGFPTSKSVKTGTTYKVKVKIGNPGGRKAKLQMYEGGKWVTKKSISLPKGAGVSTVTVTFPNSWWGKKTSWRIDIPRNNTCEAVTSKTLKLTATRVYQNPSSYVQITDKINKHGYGYYTSPVLTNASSTRSDHVEALIKTATKYKGDRYVNGKTGSPGSGIDASGLVIQACYGSGIDLWPISPATRPTNCAPSIMNAKLQKIKYQAAPAGSTDHPGMIRGDLIFFYTGTNYIGHVAIYLGYDKIIHSSYVNGKVETSTISALLKPVKDGGKYGYKVAGVRRVFY